MENNKKKAFLIGGISLALIAVLGITYAWLTQVLNGTKVNKITAGTLELVLDDEASNGIDLQNAIPQTDNQGLNNTAYTFRVINNGSINAKYSIYLEDEELESGLTRMSDTNIKFDLVKNSGSSNPRLLSTVVSNNKRVLDNNVVINGGSTNEYTLRLWIDQEATTEEVSGKAFAAKIKIEAIQTEESEVVPTTYFAFGDPTTSSTTDSTTLNKNVYAALDTEGNKGVCINRNGERHCFKTNNVEYEQQHVQQVFSDISCTVDSSVIDCYASDFYCHVTSNGNVGCRDHGTNEYCNVRSDGRVTCDM